MLYLLDADTLIRADSTYYPIRRFPIFWEWLLHTGGNGHLKVPTEQFEEVTAGKGELVDWLLAEECKTELLLQEDVSAELVALVTQRGYAPDLDEAEIEKLGRDPFLIAYGCAAPHERFIVTFEVSAPKKQRANRKIPDVCSDLGVQCGTLFDVIEALDFTTNWRPN